MHFASNMPKQHAAVLPHEPNRSSVLACTVTVLDVRSRLAVRFKHDGHCSSARPPLLKLEVARNEHAGKPQADAQAWPPSPPPASRCGSWCAAPRCSVRLSHG